jgi:hypothetical protein
MNVVSSLADAALQKTYSPRGVFNSGMANAQAESDLRYNMKPLDRAGVSRGAGRQYMAGISSARNLADGVAQAYGQQAASAATRAARELADRAADESLGLGAAGITQQDSYARALNALQRQQMVYNYANSALGGLLGGNIDNFLGF